MPVAAIELNDCGILVVGERSAGSSRRDASPGYALYDGDRLLTGLEAQVSARLKPRWINNRFWCELGTEPLRRPFPSDLSHADLAHAHLAALWKSSGAGYDAALLVVPGSYTEHQLGLLLGVARAADVPVSGLVDAAVVAADGLRATRLLHLDLQLHQAVLTELTHGGELVRGRVEIAPGAGLAALEDAWARRIAAIFVRQTRFDPLHGATTEQILFRRIAAWLEALLEQDATYATIESGSREVSVELTRGELVAAVDDRYRQLVDLVRRVKRPGEPTTLVLTHRVAGLPGLVTVLGDLPDVGVVELPPGTAAAHALGRRNVIEAPGEALPFITRLPADGTLPPGSAGLAAGGVRPPPSSAPAATDRPADAAGATRIGPPERPTHLLVDGRAYGLSDRPFALGSALPEGERGLTLRGNTAGVSRLHCAVTCRNGVVLVEDRSRHGTFLNGERFEGAIEVSAGDRLRLGVPGIEVQFIVVDTDEV